MMQVTTVAGPKVDASSVEAPQYRLDYVATPERVFIGIFDETDGQIAPVQGELNLEGDIQLEQPLGDRAAGQGESLEVPLGYVDSHNHLIGTTGPGLRIAAW